MSVSEIILFIGFLFFLAAVRKRWERHDERKSKLASLERDCRVAKFWDIGADESEKEYREKIAEHRKTDIKFELIFWSLVAAGATTSALGLARWVAENPSHTLGAAWNGALQIIAILFVGAVVYTPIHLMFCRLDNADNEIKLLNQMLRNVKDHAEGMRKASIEQFLELQNRIDALEGKSTR